MPEKNNLRKAILICVAALIVNLLGFFIAEKFNLPLFLDTGGTIFVAALGNYELAIAVGFFTNLSKSFVIPSEMYFCSVSVAIAIITTFFARQGFYTKFRKAILMIPVLTFVTGTCDLFIETFLILTDILEPAKEFQMDFIENFLYEFIDKSLSVIVAFFALKFVTPQTKKFFRMMGQRQAPLSDEIKRVVNDQSYLSSSLRTKILVLLTLSSLLLSFSVSLISYLLFKNSAIDDRIKTVDGIVTVLVSEINPYRVDDYIDYGRTKSNYTMLEEKFYAVKNSNSNIKYLYVYRFSDQGCQVVFDLNTANVAGDKAGMFIEFDKSLYPYKDDLIAGRPIPPIITNDEYGYLLTLYKPVYDAQGKCQCYAAIDFSMDIIPEYTKMFVIKLLALFLGCFVFIFAMGISFVENNIILPVNTMAYCARNFVYDSTTAREENIAQIKSLKIQTGDEIENLYSALLRTTENFKNYLEHLQRARSQVSDMQVKITAMDEIAHTDSLTGVKNKTAYVEATALLDKKILSLQADFCIVMVDVNFLKRINDNYGHECGNNYLINACKLVCAIFGTENVYRIGGDEFVVIIEGEKVSLVPYFLAQFKFEMDRKNANDALQPWEKVSAAVGVAFYEPFQDKNSDEVFKRADKEMYDNKLAMKAQRTN